MRKECSVQGRASFPGLPLPSRDQSVAFSMPSGVILLHVFRTPARGAWLGAGQSLVGSLLETMEGRFEAGERCWSPGPPGRREGKCKSSSPSLRRRFCPCPCLGPCPCPRPPFAPVSIRCHAPCACDWPVQRPSVSRVPPERAVFRRALQTLFC